MSVVIDIDIDAGGAANVRGVAPERAAGAPRTPANQGHGDVRKKVVPVVRFPDRASVNAWEGGDYIALQDWLAWPRQGEAVVLQSSDDVRGLAGKLESAALVAVDFPRINDGRGYSIAALLRRREGYAGRLRAVGQVTADQVFAMARVGFDSFELRADQDPAVALAALKTFSVAYQNTTAGPGALAASDEAEASARTRLLERALARIAASHARPALASSLSAEDMVITDVISRFQLPIAVFTLDTGRLHQETLTLIEDVRARYGVKIVVHSPDPLEVSAYAAAHGRNGFYEGVAQRKLCCAIRKVAPLNRALSGRDAWITGQRREQAATRGALEETERDAERGIAKYNPLADWSWADVLGYAARFDIPMNALYARGYVSIGCEPCTKAIRAGEDPRDGRWWWENKDSKECGLHTNATAARQ
jgi:phosphoadenosine phosphosulfate reductase